MSGWTIVKHLESSIVETRYRSCSDGREKTHWLIILLGLQSKSSKEIAQIVKYSQRWVEKLIQRYNDEGPSGLLDRRKCNRKEKLLNPELMLALEKSLELPPPDGGLWTSPKVASWMAAKLGRPVNTQTAWYYFGYLKQSLKVPRPHNPLSDPALVTEFKKKLSQCDARCSNGIR